MRAPQIAVIARKGCGGDITRDQLAEYGYVADPQTHMSKIVSRKDVRKRLQRATVRFIEKNPSMFTGMF